MRAYDEAVKLLPSKTAAQLGKNTENAEEFRLRIGFEPTALIDGVQVQLAGGVIDENDIAAVLEKATRASVHAFSQDIAKGFIGCRCGIRLGLCGAGVCSGGAVTALREISSVCIRIPHELHCALSEDILTLLHNKGANILILSPPGGGKTTLLREFVRALSTGGVRVSVADERGEIAAVYAGRPQFDLGESCDVMTDVPKAQAVMMLLRSMSPQVIAMDEISSPDDINAALSAAGCGVRLIATIHAASVWDLSKRPVYRELIKSGVFTDAVTIHNENGRRSYSCEVLS